MVDNSENLILYKEGLDVNKSLIDQILSINSNVDKPSTNKETINEPQIDESIETSTYNFNIRCRAINESQLTSETKTSTHSLNFYLEKLGALIVPFDLFEHVTYSVKNYLKPDIKIEFIYDLDNKYYWFVVIKYVYGNLLYLKYYTPKVAHQKNSLNGDISQSSLNHDETIHEDDDDLSIDDEKINFFHFILNDSNLNRLKPLGWCNKSSGYKCKIPEFLLKNFTFNEFNEEKYLNKLLNSTSHHTHSNELSNSSSTSNCINNQNLTIQSMNNVFLNNTIKSLNLTVKCISQLKKGQLLELQDVYMPINVWFVKVIDNIGGRLLLKYYYDDNNEGDDETFWLFYLDTRLHYLTWANLNNYNYKLPTFKTICNKNNQFNVETVRNRVLNNIDNQLLIIDLYKNQQKFYTHRFQLGHMLEILYENKFYVAHIIELLNEHYFKVKLHVKNDELNSKTCLKHININQDSFYMYCTATSQFIFPIKWCEQNNLKLQPPPSWPNGKKFNWDEYIEFCNRKILLSHADTETKLFKYTSTDQSLFSSLQSHHLTNICDKYKIGSYLECANPFDLDKICVGQIKHRVNHLLFIKINFQFIHIYTQNSFDLFPIGWCEMNNYKNFMLPNELKYLLVDYNDNNNKLIMRNDLAINPYLKRFNQPDLWCDQIYFNLNYNCGPYLTKLRLMKLQKSIGSGPIVLVVATLIRSLINSSTKPSKTLKLLQMSRHSQLRKNMIKMGFKTREGKKLIERYIDICTLRTQLNEYLTQLCTKLNCCYNLFGLNKLPLTETKLSVELKCFNDECLTCTSLLSSERKLRITSIVNSINSNNILNNYKTRPNMLKTVSQASKSTSNGDNKTMLRTTRSNTNSSALSHEEKAKRKLNKIKQVKREPVETRLQFRIKNLATSSVNNSIDVGSNSKITTNEGDVTISICDESDDEKSNNEIRVNDSVQRNHKIMLNQTISNRYGVLINGNPLYWSTNDVCKYLKENNLNDEHIMQLIRDNEIDGQSFLMLNLPNVQKFMKLKLGPAVKLLNLVEKSKLYYFNEFSNSSNDNHSEMYSDDDEDDSNSSDISSNYSSNEGSCDEMMEYDDVNSSNQEADNSLNANNGNSNNVHDESFNRLD